VGVEVEVRTVRAKQQNPIFKINPVQLSHFEVKKQRFSEVLQLLFAFPLDFRVDFNENLEVACHHIGKRVAIGLHLLEHIVDVLDLLLPLLLSFLALQVV